MANGTFPEPNMGVAIVELDPARGVIISFLKSSLVILCDAGAIMESAAAGAANSWSPEKNVTHIFELLLLKCFKVLKRICITQMHIN